MRFMKRRTEHEDQTQGPRKVRMERVRRVLMTADCLGGVWTYALELSRSLTDHGIEIGLATMGAPLSDAQRRQVAGIRGARLFESAYRLEWMEHPWVDAA